jgi:hypothetical protein
MSELQQTEYTDGLYKGPQMNSKNNIIAGPGKGEYWNHSPGLEKPVLREEGPFPVQGNIGGLVRHEGLHNFSKCTGLPDISGSPNCTGNNFIPDIYTSKDTCGSECTTSYPESFGDKSFGLIGEGSSKVKVTNSHGLHSYTNVRAAAEGQGPSDEYGCYEWSPRLTKTKGNSCTLNQYPAYQTVGNWANLPEANGITNYTYKE